ncbi:MULTISPECIES: cytochrome b [Phyllobacterium]|jgi:cytochrome b561|uniref:Cytochrome b n=1 Tax=Phyllobacterium sophorae TaxID=1520277 RepID=A0A2P7BIN4_9HYPH|nr:MULTISPECIES: cytochrome b [Phyllobacterium]PSH66335.1 cytochrome b [Phyllobacterium sophorae]UXN64109.1 cytochrome b [Phyllobacterium sp. A18/5-2]
MLRNTKDSFGLVSILFHWIIGFIFLGQIALGYLMVRVSDFTLQFSLYQWHKSFGFLVLGLSAFRLLWKAANARPRDLASMGQMERVAAHGAHIALYASLFIVPLTGWAVASSSPLQIPTFMFNLVVIPQLPIAISDSAEAFWSASHAWLAYLSAVIAVAHILAALHHHFWKRDTVLIRMLRPNAAKRRHQAIKLTGKSS